MDDVLDTVAPGLGAPYSGDRDPDLGHLRAVSGLLEGDPDLVPTLYRTTILGGPAEEWGGALKDLLLGLGGGANVCPL
jgi:hypothetical protein